jgi:hypothetical protein
MKRCYFHPDRPATHTDSVVDLNNSSLHETAYKRVPICDDCTQHRWEASTNRIEPLEPTYFCGAQYCDDPVCGTHGSDWVEWRKDQ